MDLQLCMIESSWEESKVSGVTLFYSMICLIKKKRGGILDE